MSNKTVDKRDLVINQAEEILLNMLKDHMDNELCVYAYLEFTFGAGIERYSINCIKNKMLRVDGTFKVKKRKTWDRKSEQYSMDDLLASLIHYLSLNLRVGELESRADEIIEKYGTIVYLDGIGCCLKRTLLGIKSECFDKYYNDFEKMIKEYILKA